jgi:hypothetical protein
MRLSKLCAALLFIAANTLLASEKYAETRAAAVERSVQRAARKRAAAGDVGIAEPTGGGGAERKRAKPALTPGTLAACTSAAAITASAHHSKPT